MSNTVTAHTIVNGRRNLILQFNIVADGSGDYSAAELFDVTDYTDDGASPIPNDFKVMKVSGRNGVGTTFQLLFGSTAENNKLFFESTADDEFCEDWSNIGGLSTLLPSADMSVRITTSGFDTSADTLSLVIWVKKKYTRVNG
jgi:hypothetical protein